MKNLLFTIGLILFFMKLHAQEQYTKTYDSVRNHNTYEGLLSTSINEIFHQKNFFFSELESANFSNTKINQSLLRGLIHAQENPTISMVVIGGIWWCPDTRDILSKLVVYTDSTHFNQITCIGIDRKKQSFSYPLVNQYKVERVPTLIIFKNNQEIGRVVEYGKRGNWEKELSNILRKAIK